MSYTLAHIIRFKLEKLRKYESRLRETTYEIEWKSLDPNGGAIDRPAKNHYLQLADLVASAIGAAFHPDDYGNVEPRYLVELAPRFYRRNDLALTDSGLKLYPTIARGDEVQEIFPWMQGLR